VESFFQLYAGKILGISFEAGTDRGEVGSGTIADLLNLLIGVRADVRAQKLWALSDKIRDGLNRLGYSLEDKREGTTWKRTS
jgi:cysteinyl-tRNA synthetase